MPKGGSRRSFQAYKPIGRMLEPTRGRRDRAWQRISRECMGTGLVKVWQSQRRGVFSGRLGLACAGATQQQVVLTSPVTAGHTQLLLLLPSPSPPRPRTHLNHLEPPLLVSFLEVCSKVGDVSSKHLHGARSQAAANPRTHAARRGFPGMERVRVV